MPKSRRRLEDRGRSSDGFITEASKLVSKGFKDYIRGRLYRTVNPLGDYNIKEHGKRFINNDSIDYPDAYRDENGNLYVEFEDAGARLDVADDIWANYLNIPKNQRRFNTRIQKSKYIPRRGGDKNETYYRLPLDDYEREILLDETNDLNINSNKVSNILANYNLADHTIGRGFDNRGEYRSYYDRFDLNPFNGKYQGTKIPVLDKLNDVSLGIGKPVNIYDRIYLDDYYGVKNPTHGVYLPEITVRGNRRNKKINGGDIDTITSYGYPVYWSDENPNYKWADNFLKNNRDVTGFASGGGAQGVDDMGPRVIIRNPYSNYIKRRDDYRWNNLDKLEAARHYMNEINYNPTFKYSPEQEEFRKNNFTKKDPYSYDDRAWKQSIISRIIANDMDGTSEQIKEANNIIRALNNKADNYYNIPIEHRGGNYLPEIIVKGKRTKHKYGGIHIAPSKRGTFTAAATKHGMGVQEFAARVLRNKNDYSPSLVKKANFARNASKWNH